MKPNVVTYNPLFYQFLELVSIIIVPVDLNLISSTLGELTMNLMSGGNEFGI